MEADFTENMSQFLNAYMTCALWSSTDDEDEALDTNYSMGDIGADSIISMTIDCHNFYNENYAIWMHDMDCSQAGHDFWLTRNGHGTGFWDRGNGRVGDILTERSHAMGEVELHVENNKVYYS